MKGFDLLMFKQIDNCVRLQFTSMRVQRMKVAQHMRLVQHRQLVQDCLKKRNELVNSKGE